MVALVGSLDMVDLERGHVDQGTYSLDAAVTWGEGAAHGLTRESLRGGPQPESWQGVAELPRAGPGFWWILGPAQKHVLSRTSPFLPE